MSIKHSDNNLAGGYILLAAYANLTDEEFAAEKDNDETPVAFIAVKETFLMNWIDNLSSPGYRDIDDFLDSYTYDDIIGLEETAALQDALAFSYRPSLDRKFDFPAACEGEAMLAFADFISGKLQDNGFENASKYLDCLLDI